MRTVKRRRKENKTDYANRIRLLKSGIPRIVFRKTNKYLLVQYVTSKEAQDKIEINLTSKELLKYGWPEEFKGSLKSIPAAYFTGVLISNKIKDKKLKNPIVDFGMLRVLHKTKVFAYIKGLIDSGLEIESSKEDAFPEEERILGKHLKNKIDVSKIKSGIDALKGTSKL